MNFYRYKTEYDINDRVIVKLLVYEIYKETEKGFWVVEIHEEPKIGYWTGEYIFNKHFILKKPGRKKYAYPTKKEALNNYILRTEKYKKILENNLHHCKKGLEFALKINTDE